MPERWKIWAMLTMSAPASRGRQRLGHPGEGEVDVAVGEVLLRNDVDAGLDDLDVEAVTLEDARVAGRDVAGELRLDRPLQAQRDLVDRCAITAGAVSVPLGSVVPVLAPAVDERPRQE